MLTSEKFCDIFRAISAKMAEEREYLVELDQRNGDGDLGISMSDGYAAASAALDASAERDLGKLCICAGKSFNEAAPSSLGTITAICLMGMARIFKGHTEADIALAGEALLAGTAKITEKAGSKIGEKTILDAIIPAAEAICSNADKGTETALAAAAEAAAKGADSTADMAAVHGRAAYYSDKGMGLIDGGAIVGRMIFETIAETVTI
ncbi:DAK2 domain-containing protein [Marvinbryantia sp.]|uniref:DAK2 domain-containing protein n=1 Tax=Marvinbryantia sp. TaxID=2496532 RepID=UPI0025E25480|nr:DAK2 domain-containing protein [uncultured Marvinbryantia sp.]